jgi:hypothetical protein
MWQAAAVTVPRIIAGTATRDNPTVLRRSLIALVAAAGRAADDARMRRAVRAGDGAIPLLHWAGGLSFGALVALAFVTGIPAGAHSGAQSSIVAELLRRCAQSPT